MEGDDIDFGQWKEVESMAIDEHLQFVIRCQFNAFCKTAIRNKAAEIKRNSSKRWSNEFHFEDLAPAEQERVQIIEGFFEEEVTHYFVDGKVITDRILYKAIESLPEKRRAVIHLYFFDELTETEIAELLNIAQPSVNESKRRSLKKIKEYLEEHRHDDEG